MSKVLIITAIHKEYWVPKDKMYLPIQVGDGDSLGFIRDNSGDNISNKNKNYCELTAMYWVYKNLHNYDYIGLDHYRRHFSKNILGNKKYRVITERQINKYLNEDVVILPKPRNYYIETNYSQYIHAHNEEDLVITRQIINEKYPEYIITFDKYMKLTKGHRFNMMVMPKGIFINYCEWLFDILFELENRLNINDYSKYDQRVFGFVSERLLDVYIYHNNIKFTELPYVYMERINWIKKGIKFLGRKFNRG